MHGNVCILTESRSFTVFSGRTFRKCGHTELLVPLIPLKNCFHTSIAARLILPENILLSEDYALLSSLTSVLSSHLLRLLFLLLNLCQQLCQCCFQNLCRDFSAFDAQCHRFFVYFILHLRPPFRPMILFQRHQTLTVPDTGGAVSPKTERNFFLHWCIM